MSAASWALPGAIPSPDQGVWHLGPLPIRAYALCILTGIVVAAFIFKRRYEAKGGPGQAVWDLLLWMVPFGIIGGRIYHVISSPAAYFGEHGDPIRALYIWQGGLGIWGAIALGAVGAWLGARQMGLRLAPLADALAPALLVAQAIGRLGNWFNQELFGAPTTAWWGLQIDDAHNLGYPSGTLFHPTFLYELLWNLAAAAVLIWLAKRFDLRHGRQFWLYVMLYTTGRVWIEMLRIDTAEHIFGLRLNVWTSIITFAIATALFIRLGRQDKTMSVQSEGDSNTPDPIYLPGHQPDEEIAAATAKPSLTTVTQEKNQGCDERK